MSKIFSLLIMTTLMVGMSAGQDRKIVKESSVVTTTSDSARFIYEERHPHPHVDPRQPRHQTAIATNPPVFAWKPFENAAAYKLVISRNVQFTDTTLYINNLQESIFLPDKALDPDRYYWKWGTKERESSVFSFDVPTTAVVLPVPHVGEWLQRFPKKHPRIYIRPEDLDELRRSRFDSRQASWRFLKQQADSLLNEPHEIEEPAFLPDIKEDYEKWFSVFFDAMWESRHFVKGAETLALAYLSSGDTLYARAACRRMAFISKWDPYGSSYIGHNDEPHMSVIWHGPQACDWVWDQFTPEERALVIEQFYQRGKMTYEYMHDRGAFGVTRFDSHSGREIVFLAMTALVFHDHIPEAGKWLQWLRPVLCGIWPIWAGEDGAWAEGPSYATAYVTIMTMFATALKHGADVDLYQRPFWKGHARWRQYCWPPYAEWLGFGDHTERWQSNWNRNADLVEHIALETGMGAIESYIEAMRREAKKSPQTPAARNLPGLMSQKYLLPAENKRASSQKPLAEVRIFADAGWAAIRTHLQQPQKDIAFVFRSSPYGAISHSHASNNDFFLHVGGNIMLMPSGYYSGYGSGHHAHWVWHTKSHNCLTLSDAPQLLRSHDSRGAIIAPYEDDNLIYFQGNADPSYQTRAMRCRRHVVFLKLHHCFLLVDEFIAKPGVVSSLQWNVHSWSPFTIDDEKNRFIVERRDSKVEGYFLYHQNAFFTRSEGWEPPPAQVKQSREQWKMQYNLRFTVSEYRDRQNLGVVLAPSSPQLPVAALQTWRDESTEICRIGADLILVGVEGSIKYESLAMDGIAFLQIGNQQYQLDSNGIRMYKR
jgi:hypothetical protein